MEEGRSEELRTQSWYRAGLVVCASRPTLIIIGGPAINRPKYVVRLKLWAVNKSATRASLLDLLQSSTSAQELDCFNLREFVSAKQGSGNISDTKFRQIWELLRQRTRI